MRLRISILIVSLAPFPVSKADYRKIRMLCKPAYGTLLFNRAIMSASLLQAEKKGECILMDGEHQDSLSITIYTNPNCQFCREAVAFFKRNGLSFLDLDASDEQNQRDMLALGGIATPFIIVGRRIFHSFDKGTIEEEIRRYEG